MQQQQTQSTGTLATIIKFSINYEISFLTILALFFVGCQTPKKDYDFVFIVCPPGFSALSENIFNAADIVLMPVIPTTLSIRTYHMVKDYFKEKDLDMSRLMCFFTMADLRKNMHNEIMEELYKDKRFFENYIPYLSDVEKMGVHKAPIMEFANSSYAAKCYRELWTEIKEGVLE